MRKTALGWGVAAAALLSLSLVLGCAQPGPTASPAGEEPARSVDQLLADLDALGASPGRSLLPALSIPKPSGQAFTAAELSAYLGGIKVDLAGFVAKTTAGKPNLVMPVRLKANGQSGLMWVPVAFGRRLDVPVIAFQHGTQVYWKSAPSRYDANPLSILAGPDVAGAFQNYVECTTAALMASAGYIVVMADYPGFGDSRAPHPYLHLSLGESVATMLERAATVLSGPFSAARPNGKLFLIGYSEGGFATMAAAKALDGRMAVTAAVPCAGAYDLAGVMTAEILSGRPAITPFYVPYTVFGFASVYRGVEPAVWDYENLLKGKNDPPYFCDLPGLLPYLFSGEYPAAAVSSQMPTQVPLEMLTGSLVADLASGLAAGPAGTGGPVHKRLAENTVFRTGWLPKMPIQMIHCPIDDVVPVENTLAVAAAWAGLLNVLEPIPVPPIPVPGQLGALVDVHMLAFPTAMLAGFTFIEKANAQP